MMNVEDLAHICQEGVDYACGFGADQAEVYGEATRRLAATIEKDDLQLSESHAETTVGIRAFVGDRVGFASTNDISGLKQACQDAVALAKSSPGDPHNVLPEPAKIEPLDGIYDPAAEGFNERDAVASAIRMLELAHSIDRRLILGDASFTAEVFSRAIANTAGLRASEKGSLFTYFALATAKEGDLVSNFDFQFDASRSVDGIDVEPITRRACENALGSLGAGKGRSFNGTVVLSPNAALDLLVSLILFQANARNSLKGMSRWKDAIGRPVAASTLTVIDDGRLSGGVASSSFDREGAPHRRVTLIEDGRLASFLHNAYTADALKTPNTAHGSGSARSVPGIGPTNLSILPGEGSKEDMISDVKEGLFVTRFSGNTNPISGDFSGVAKAAYLIENGKLSRPVAGTLVAGNAFSALEGITGISEERERIYNFTLPYLRLEGISVTAE